MAIDNKNLLVWVKAMSRGQPFPLDASEVHESLADAEEYAKTATAYAGQTIKVKLEDGKYHEFILQPSNGGYSLEEVRSASEDESGGIYVGSEETMPEDTVMRIDPEGEAYELIEIDNSLSKAGYAADAAKVGEELRKITEAMNSGNVGSPFGKVFVSASIIGNDVILGDEILTTPDGLDEDTIHKLVESGAVQMFIAKPSENGSDSLDEIGILDCLNAVRDAENIGLTFAGTVTGINGTRFVLVESNLNNRTATMIEMMQASASEVSGNVLIYVFGNQIFATIPPAGVTGEQAEELIAKGAFTVIVTGDDGHENVSHYGVLQGLPSALHDGIYAEGTIVSKTGTSAVRVALNFYTKTATISEIISGGTSGDEIYVLGEGETVEDAPETAKEIIDPYNDSESVDLGNFATKADLRNLSEAIANLGTVYIGKEQPTDGTLYWLDTSDSETESVSYRITKNLTNVTIDNTAETVIEKSSYAATLTADEGHTLSSVTVTMGGADITSVSYDNGNIYIASVTGDIAIIAVAVESAETVLYTITNNLVNVSTNNSAVSVEKGAAYTAILTASDGYDLDSVTVKMGGEDVTADVYVDGVISIPSVTGDVVITATTVKRDEYTVDVPISAMNSTLTIYAEDGTTQTGESIRCHFKSENFVEETDVKITMVVSKTNYATIKYWIADTTNKKAIVGGTSFPKSTTYYEPDTSYVAILTVPAGYGIAVSVSNNAPDPVTVSARKKG